MGNLIGCQMMNIKLFTRFVVNFLLSKCSFKANY